MNVGVAVRQLDCGARLTLLRVTKNTAEFLDHQIALIIH